MAAVVASAPDEQQPLLRSEIARQTATGASPESIGRSAGSQGENEDEDEERADTLSAQASAMVRRASRRAARLYSAATPLQRVLGIGLLLALCAAFMLFVTYSAQIFTALQLWAQHWRQVRGGWVFLWLAIIVTAFPPIPGYAFCMTLSGFLYGFPDGWYLAASASIVGATLSFITCRAFLLPVVKRFLSNDERFQLYLRVLKHGEVKLLCMLKLCPLPYSLSNAAFAATPSVSLRNFVLASALVTPKLLTHIIIGSQLAAGITDDPWTNFLRYASVVFALVVGTGTAIYVYRKTKALAASDRHEHERHV